jgi:hypothetical protein
MFGAIGKYLLVTLLIVGLVGAWWLRARSNRRKEQERKRDSDVNRRLKSLNLEACPVCGAYGPADGQGCGRPDCPKA